MPVRYSKQPGPMPTLSRLIAAFVATACLAAPSFADSRSALPAAVANFKLTHPAQLYTPSTLENHIDGEAESVKHYDFRECAYGEYAPGGRGNQLITVDIYQMGTPTDAWGYYSSQQNANAKQVTVGGAHGYEEATALNFWKGAYCVKVTITASNPGPFQAELPKIATAVASKLSGSAAVPAIVKLLPPGYSPRTEQYQRSNIAAQSYLVNGVLARYPSAGPQAELFVSVYSSPAAAKTAFGKYQKDLSDPSKMAAGAKPAPVKGLGDSAIAVKSRFAGEVVAATKGKYVIGVRKAKDQAGAAALVKAAIAHAH